MNQSTEINELAKALASAQAEMSNAPLNRQNPHFKSKYADLAAVRDATIPALAKHGLALTQVTTAGDNGFALRTMLTHSSGQWLASDYPIPLSDKPQIMGSAITYARRYSWAALCGIAAEEDDDANAAQDGAKANGNKPIPRRTSGAGVTSNAAKRRDPSGKNLWDHFQDDLRHCTTAEEVAQVERFWLSEAEAGRFPEGWADDMRDVCSKWLADLTSADLGGALRDSVEHEKATDPIKQAMNSLPDNPVIAPNAKARHDGPPEGPPDFIRARKRPRPPGKRLSGADAIAVFNSLNGNMQKQKTVASLEAWANEAPTQNAITSLPDDMYYEFRDDFAARMRMLPENILEAG